MERLLVTGGRPLAGEVRVSGAKNSALALLPAAALADGESILHNIPDEIDIDNMIAILRSMGVDCTKIAPGTWRITAGDLKPSVPYDLVRKMRASFYVAGVLLARTGRAEVPLPGGCALGSRPVDFHLRGFQTLGAKTNIERGMMIAESQPGGLTGATYFINRSSMGTTVNLMLAASLAKGTTILENAAKEPEIVDLAVFLNAMGANVRGAGTNVIRIEGVKRLRGAEHTIIPDRIEAGTFLLGGAITKGEVIVTDVVPEHLHALLLKLAEAGVSIDESGTAISLRARDGLRAVDVETAPYPGFPTDLQQPFVSLMSVARGTSIVRETIFDRFRYVDELRRLGADVKVERDTAIVRGVEKLTAAPVEATDLRAGAALIIAGLVAEGTTEITGVEHLRRGYENLEQKWRGLGAQVRLVEDDQEAKTG